MIIVFYDLNVTYIALVIAIFNGNDHIVMENKRTTRVQTPFLIINRKQRNKQEYKHKARTNIKPITKT